LTAKPLPLKLLKLPLRLLLPKLLLLPLLRNPLLNNFGTINPKKNLRLFRFDKSL
jgi:hypothetical protein